MAALGNQGLGAAVGAVAVPWLGGVVIHGFGAVDCTSGAPGAAGTYCHPLVAGWGHPGVSVVSWGTARPGTAVFTQGFGATVA
ncbi:MAG: hypothetical protein HPY44_01265 [Armatimonadetes bacterium]|nr:hypothetical protein [Armatimonadota bacterium]